MKIIIVDAISTGEDLAVELVRRGEDCIQVCSKADYFNESVAFTQSIVIEDDLALATAIDEGHFDGVSHVIAGAEPGVTLADTIADRLSLTCSNTLQTTDLRRNKYRAQEQLARVGIRSIRQKLITQFKNEQVVDYDMDLPVIVKPLNSGASDGVSLCLTNQEFQSSIQRNLGKTNLLGHVNSELLLQDYIEGVQYFVNTVSWQGEVYTTDVWKTYRRKVPGTMFIFEGMTLCDPESNLVKDLVEYNNRVLSSLGLEYGAAHNEIIVDSSGPILVESNARLMGASINKSAFSLALDRTQIEVLVDAYTNNGFSDNCRIYKLGQSLAEISLVFEKSGQIKELLSEEYIRKLDSFHCESGIPSIGENVQQTRDTIGSAGFIYLLNHCPSKLNEDFHDILRLVKEDKIYKIS
ncbi:ATP-grasp domain-containing protein [Vibrio sp. Of7-15]|uniref:ATP-grasp domain-containing protein n=1 Tax=Vibrio sp. Of7-15 TaxID=2724879 RepID=UPI001EF3D307|nr:ATP-grasp domain-containing protein [Vibrio sp. Of7-15]MCG7498653.1 ATP-grasp domain-containing protein [Vibrio sp. Of7-15]